MITWQTNLTVKQLSDGIVSIMVIRTDDAEPDESWSYTVDNIDSNKVTIAQLADYIYKAYLEHSTRQAAITSKKLAIEFNLNTALMSKET